MPEKLLTIKEVAAHLKISEDEVKRLVDVGEIPAYKIGGSFLRFRKEQIDAIRDEVSDFEKKAPQVISQAASSQAARHVHPFTDLEREIKRKEPTVRQYDYTILERVRDFFYFYDFYIISAAIICWIMYIILYNR